MAHKIAIIIGSTRKPRVGPEVAKFIKTILEPNAGEDTLSLVDVAEFNLPVYDEVGVMPAMVPEKGSFANAHSKAWSVEIAKYDAYIMVANEYNFGVSGATKNAIDYLYNDWIGKPMLIITYGIFGGTNASDQLKTILNGMKLKVVETRPALGFAGGQGPDLWAAAAGQLGEASRTAWTENKGDLVKGFSELQALLKSE